MNLSEGLTHIKEQVSPNSLTDSCSGDRCTVYLTDIPKKRVVINVEKEFDARGYEHKRCDRMLFYENKNTCFAVPIELKGRGKGGESQVLDQLKNGLEFAASLVQNLKEPVYVPIVLTQKGIKWTNPRRRRQGLKLTFKGKKLTVLIGSCDKPKNLANLLSQAGYLSS